MGAFQMEPKREITWTGSWATRQKAEWDHLYLGLLQKLREAIRESRDDLARTADDGEVWANLDGVIFGKDHLSRRDKDGKRQVLSFDSMTLSGIRKIAEWNWVPNRPKSALERLAECAE